MPAPSWLDPDFTLSEDGRVATAAMVAAEAERLASTLPEGGSLRLPVGGVFDLLAALLACESAGADLYLVRDGAAEPPASASASGRVWLQTSGSTGAPRWIGHRPEALRGLIQRGRRQRAKWLLSYGAGSFAGLQVVLSAALGGHELVAPPRGASAIELAALAIDRGVTHLSGTPTFWRGFLIAVGRAESELAAVTLGGEAADQALLDALARRFPAATLRHIYATTETGAVFSVGDGRAGFPASWLDRGVDGARLAITERGTLAVASARRAVSIDGEFLDTGDCVTVAGDRVLFRGRIDSMVNVGGVKIWPEEVEAHLLRLGFVRDVLVSARPNPVTGQILTADLVVDEASAPPAAEAAIRRHLMSLPRAARPAAIRFTSGLPTGQTGKKRRIPS
jgi:acyl-coenzyme A synthetase/AMP-(fatty) acid ligase